MEQRKLKEGDIYLTVSIKATDLVGLCMAAIAKGEPNVILPAFKNEDKVGNQPDYKSFSCAVWKSTVKSKEESVVDDI